MPEGAEVQKQVSRTEGETKDNAPKEFSLLTTPEKVKAILAVVGEPVTQETIYKIADIEPDKLTDEQKEAINSIFHDPRIKQVRNEKFNVDQYCIDPKKQNEVFKEIESEPSSAEMQIIDYYMKKVRR